MSHDASCPHFLRYRALTPDQCAAIAASMKHGVTSRELAAAYGVSRRTIFRAAARADERHLEVRVGDWWASYAITDEGPVQLTPWLAAKDPTWDDYIGAFGSAGTPPWRRKAQRIAAEYARLSASGDTGGAESR